jgi:hypothetical protein
VERVFTKLRHNISIQSGVCPQPAVEQTPSILIPMSSKTPGGAS